MSKGALALQTIFDVVKSAYKEGVKAPEEVSQLRIEVCNNCPKFDGEKCGVCGCYMKYKTKLLAAKCPENYWDQKLVEKAMFGEIDNEYIQQKCCGDN